MQAYAVACMPQSTRGRLRSHRRLLFRKSEVSKGVSQTKASEVSKGFSKESLQAADGGAPRASRRAFGRAGFDKIWRDFSVVQHASASRHGGSPAAGLAASRHPRRDRQQLHRCSGGLRLPAAPCSAGVPLQAQMLAAWRRPPRGALVGPRCQGRIRSGRPFKAPNGHGGRSRARRPSGEPGLRGVARVDLCIARENHVAVSLMSAEPHMRAQAAAHRGASWPTRAPRRPSPHSPQTSVCTHDSALTLPECLR